MTGVIRRTATTLAVGAALATATATPAFAQTATQNGLVNVAVGDINVLNNANIGVAAQVAASICGVKVGPVAVLGTAVDASGATMTVCNTANGPITITQA